MIRGIVMVAVILAGAVAGLGIAAAENEGPVDEAIYAGYRVSVAAVARGPTVRDNRRVYLSKSGYDVVAIKIKIRRADRDASPRSWAGAFEHESSWRVTGAPGDFELVDGTGRRYGVRSNNNDPLRDIPRYLEAAVFRLNKSGKKGQDYSNWLFYDLPPAFSFEHVALQVGDAWLSVDRKPCPRPLPEC
ncbi:MAG: hypothetical protein AAGE01_04475 [Pseudomonadota bacterium]